MKQTASPDTISRVPLTDRSREELARFSEEQGFSLSGSDLVEIRDRFRKLEREPTRVELEVLAQTWSEHCKHRIFNANIEHRIDGEPRDIDSIFNTFVREVTEEIRAEKPDLVQAAFDDNAGFMKLDEDWSACMKVETHNHPSAIEPYAGANTGLGGVIRDILGAGLGARPIGSVDVFCLGSPEIDRTELPGGVIHPLGIFRGVVQGVRDYGNRMGIPTLAGAIRFAPDYTYNPLVFCGTVGILPTEDVDKQIRPGQVLMTAGGRTGRDGLHGATFSSDTLSYESHEEDQGSVQIGNPIEEKKVLDFLLEARREGLLEHINDCGAGGYSSAVGEMVEEAGGRVDLEKIPLKEEGMDPWEIFLSESQERMVIAVDPSDVDRLQALADLHGTRCEPIGEVTGNERLDVFYEGTNVCRLDCGFLHSPPRMTVQSRYETPDRTPEPPEGSPDVETVLRGLLGDVNVASREPVIREYDHMVQGNTVLGPLAGATGDNPQDGVVLRVEGTDRGLAVGLALQPEYGRLDPYRMGQSTVDEALRQVVVAGADPERVSLLDNFSMGNPERPEKLGELVEAARGMAEAARSYGTPFISGKDSFYNSYDRADGSTVSVPMTLVVSALGVVDPLDSSLGSSMTRPDSVLLLAGRTRRELGGSEYYQREGGRGGEVPRVDPERFRDRYRGLHECIREGWVRSAHDLSGGGLGVGLAEMSFSRVAGVEVELDGVPREDDLSFLERVFSESAGRVLLEVGESDVATVRDRLGTDVAKPIGRTTDEHRRFILTGGGTPLVDCSIEELKDPWTNGLKPYY